MVTLEIDGKEVNVPQGTMVIEAADSIGVTIPRFCYHKKLSVAANCRMCLVQVENAPKPLPACATPVSQGMKVLTQSECAQDAQKSVMEFLLINHPLDCPICDQGGQCELQDLAVGYGQDTSQYSEKKRVAQDFNLGPLIQTDMTRCIHCTRCVRFGQEIAGVREMGATGRGEHMQIGTYIEKSVDSELSGNVIDLCPVGALTSKPFRYKARAWELVRVPAIGFHDGMGSNLFFHTQHEKVLRVVPRASETINEVWLSDRDRFSYEAFNSTERLETPMLKREGQWESISWKEAFSYLVDAVSKRLDTNGPSQLGALVSPNASVEEIYLLQKILRSKGCHNIDHRLRQLDFAGEEDFPVLPGLGTDKIKSIRLADCIGLIGTHLRSDQPILNHAVRRASLNKATICSIDPLGKGQNFEVAVEVVPPNGDLLAPLAQLVKAVLVLKGQPAKEECLASIEVAPDVQQFANALVAAETPYVFLGSMAIMHPHFSIICQLVHRLQAVLNVQVGLLLEGANGAGAWWAGGVPHRGPGGQALAQKGKNARQMLEKGLQAVFLWNMEPHLDTCMGSKALETLKQASLVVSFSPFINDTMKTVADLILPIVPPSETPGTYVNLLGHWQTVQPGVSPLGEARPGWKVLRVLGHQLGVEGFEYSSAQDVLDELTACASNGPAQAKSRTLPQQLPSFETSKVIRLGPVFGYGADNVVRRSAPLAQTALAKQAKAVHMSSALCQRLGLDPKGQVHVTGDDESSSQSYPIEIDDSVPLGTVIVHMGLEETVGLGQAYRPVTLQPA